MLFFAFFFAFFCVKTVGELPLKVSADRANHFLCAVLVSISLYLSMCVLC